MKIAVLLGGMSAEREISLATGRAVAEALRSRGHSVVEIDCVDPVATTQEEEFVRTEVVFVALHGGFGEDGRIQALLELADKPYVGSGPAACALSMDKSLSKHLCRSLDIATAPWRVLHGDEAVDEVLQRASEVGEDVVLKPVDEGSAIGVWLRPSPEELAGIWTDPSRRPGRWLLERYIPGRELTLPMIWGEAAPAVEVKPKEGFYDYRNKYTPGRTEYLCPAPLPDQVARALAETGRRIWDALPLRDMARIDFRLDKEEHFFFLEINTIPGMTATSLLPMGAREMGLDFPEFCERLCAGALEREAPATGGGL